MSEVAESDIQLLKSILTTACGVFDNLEVADGDAIAIYNENKFAVVCKMSVIAQCQLGWLLCHEKYINCVFNENNPNDTKVKIKSKIFQVKTAFIMDSQAKKIAQQLLNANGTSQGENPPNLKKRKRKEYNTPNQNSSSIISAAQTIAALSKDFFYTTQITIKEIEDNNRTARNEVARLHPNDNLSELCKNQNISGQTPFVPVLIGKDKNIDKDIPALVINNQDNIVPIQFQTQEYLIPPKSSFILANLDNTEKLLLHLEKKYDVILLDPPWQNKSIKRLKKYFTLPNERLLKIPIKSLANKNCLILVWTTNNLDQNSFVKDTLFPHWDIKHIATWHWVKVTRYGDFAVPLNSPNKNIYENLILGQCGPNIEVSNEKIIENGKIIVSIPSLVHSHKPPLTEILKPYLRENSECLELFARYLLPNWTSCGNEVLTLQNSNYYDF